MIIHLAHNQVKWLTSTRFSVIGQPTAIFSLVTECVSIIRKRGSAHPPVVRHPCFHAILNSPASIQNCSDCSDCSATLIAHISLTANKYNKKCIISGESNVSAMSIINAHSHQHYKWCLHCAIGSTCSTMLCITLEGWITHAKRRFIAASHIDSLSQEETRKLETANERRRGYNGRIEVILLPIKISKKWVIEK